MFFTKGHFFFRFETETAKDKWWHLLTNVVGELKVSPEKLFNEDPR